MRIQHEIFSTPNKVNLTIAEQKTPESYADYPEGKSFGKTMPMWRVQTEGYTTHKGQLVGIVSSDSGFLDSPDTEWISGGVNSKGPKAVALGRHGNFFHWGFAASPTYLTEEAKDVFVNAVHYISKFDRQAPIVRKTKGTMMRSSVVRTIEGMSEEGYAKTVAVYSRFRAERKIRNAEIKARIDAGEAVSENERRSLTYPVSKTPGRMAGASRLLTPEQLASCGDSPEKASALLREMTPYLRPSGYYTLAVDKELKALGIANSDLALLDRAVALMDTKGEELARVLLERYTEESFATASEWASWLKENRSRLFFTEAGGYKWFVNTLDKPRTSKSAVATPKKSRESVTATPESPFAAELVAQFLGKGRYRLTVNVDILEGWHAYHHVPSNAAYTPFRIHLDLPKGVTQEGKWKKPQAQASPENPNLTIYEGRLEFSCEVSAHYLTVPTKVGCVFSYQVCNDRMCLPPTTTAQLVILQPQSEAASR